MWGSIFIVACMNDWPKKEQHKVPHFAVHERRTLITLCKHYSFISFDLLLSYRFLLLLTKSIFPKLYIRSIGFNKIWFVLLYPVDKPSVQSTCYVLGGKKNIWPQSKVLLLMVRSCVCDCGVPLVRPEPSYHVPAGVVTPPSTVVWPQNLTVIRSSDVLAVAAFVAKHYNSFVNYLYRWEAGCSHTLITIRVDRLCILRLSEGLLVLYRNRLIEKVQIQTSILGGLLKWTETFWTGKKRRTHVRGAFSERAKVISGVP